VPTSAGQAGRRHGDPDDGYRHFALPAFGSMPGVSDDQVTDICKAWFVAEMVLVRRMMRRIADNDPDRQQDAASIVAVAYLQAVRNGNGIARLVRDHLAGRVPIREPKAVFITTVEHHRRAALRWVITERGREEHEETSEDELEQWVVRRLKVLRAPDADDSFQDRCLRVRVDLVKLAESQDVPPAASALVDGWLTELERLCVEPLRRHGVLASLTDRQRLVFLLRVDPLNIDDATALEYQQIEPLAGILGTPMKAENLRQTLRAALARVRRLHPDLKEELGHG
jgi:hypothetical protein